jgi:mRNA interferase RelE/StbE
MKISYCTSFFRDLSKIQNPLILESVRSLILIIEASESIKSIPDFQKIKGSNNYFRIRIGDYRVGVYKNKDQIEFVRILNRKDIYKYFPK